MTRCVNTWPTRYLIYVYSITFPDTRHHRRVAQPQGISYPALPIAKSYHSVITCTHCLLAVSSDNAGLGNLRHIASIILAYYSSGNLLKDKAVIQPEPMAGPQRIAVRTQQTGNRTYKGGLI